MSRLPTCRTTASTRVIAREVFTAAEGSEASQPDRAKGAPVFYQATFSTGSGHTTCDTEVRTECGSQPRTVGIG